MKLTKEQFEDKIISLMETYEEKFGTDELQEGIMINHSYRQDLKAIGNAADADFLKSEELAIKEQIKDFDANFKEKKFDNRSFSAMYTKFAKYFSLSYIAKKYKCNLMDPKGIANVNKLASLTERTLHSMATKGKTLDSTKLAGFDETLAKDKETMIKSIEKVYSKVNLDKFNGHDRKDDKKEEK